MSANQPEKTIEDALNKLVWNITISGYGKEDEPNELIEADDVQPFAGYQFHIRETQAALSAMVDTLIKEAKPAEYQAHSWQSGLEKKAFDNAVRVYEYKLRELAAKMGFTLNKEDK